jgi:WD40 repeat protein
MSGSELFIPCEFPPEENRLLAFNPRGSRLAVSHMFADHVQIFDTRSGERLTRLDGLTGVSRVLFMSAEVLLVAAFGGCYRCNLRGGTRDVITDKGWQAGVALSQDGRLLALGEKMGLVLYDLARNTIVGGFSVCFNSEDAVYHAEFSPGGRYLAADVHAGGRAGGIVVVWDIQTGRRQRVYDTRGYAFAFRGETLTLAVAADSGYVEVYEPDQGEAVTRQFFFDYRLPRVMESRDGDRALAMLLDGGEFVQVDWDTGAVLRRRAPPAGHKLSHDLVTTKGWTHFAGTVEGGVLVWPGDRAEPGAAADGGGLSAC